jgi:hypothetical protein
MPFQINNYTCQPYMSKVEDKSLQEYLEFKQKSFDEYLEFKRLRKGYQERVMSGYYTQLDDYGNPRRDLHDAYDDFKTYQQEKREQGRAKLEHPQDVEYAKSRRFAQSNSNYYNSDGAPPNVEIEYNPNSTPNYYGNGDNGGDGNSLFASAPLSFGD